MTAHSSPFATVKTSTKPSGQVNSALRQLAAQVTEGSWHADQIAARLVECDQAIAVHGQQLNSDLYLESIGRAPCLTPQWQQLKKDNITLREQLMRLRVELASATARNETRKLWCGQLLDLAELATEYESADEVLLQEAFAAPDWVDPI